ncbi:MAG: protoporphyrinogen oxidase [Gammaproteobacteria bacterium]|jgi:HemY protein|nr:protoporphyrinogen oxidase [Gammaproteobacteria bacterium]
MKRLITLLIILGFAAWAGISIAKDPGYMLLAWHQWTLETPLWFGIILWLVFAFAIIFLVTIWRMFGNISSNWHAWRKRRKLTRSNNLTIRGLLECIEGYYESAEKNINKALPNAEIPLVDYIIAAYCANQLGKTEARDTYLLNAKNLVPDAESAIHLLKIQWLIAQNEVSQAQTELDLLLSEDPYQPRALMLAKELHLRAGHWDPLLKITQLLRKRKIITPEAHEDLQSKAYAAKILEAANSKDVKTLNACWLTIPSQYQTLPSLVLVYAKALVDLDQGNMAEEALRDSLKKYWDDELVRCYGLAVTNNIENQLKQAEKWLPDHENDAVLLLTLGRLCARAQLWAKARSYLEASLNLAETPETYHALAELAQSHQEYAKAAEYYAKGLMLSLKK